MNYRETTEWMFRQLPMYQTQGAVAYKKDLKNTHLLLSHLNNPEMQLKCIHVAGTNGKGSTSHMLASILHEAGYKVGLYTSPHLKDFRERIKIGSQQGLITISEQFVVDFIATHQRFFEDNDLSFFEMTVGLAFEYFKKEQVDIAIIEVGMGGRLDATNVIKPLISVITNIGLDHTQFLGSTLAAIAAEKAGIIKQNTPVVIGEFNSETKEVFEQKAKKLDAPIYFASDLVQGDFASDLLGFYQEFNKKTVIQTIRILQDQGEYVVNEQHLQDGLQNVIRNTGLQGRWQQLRLNPKVICDTAHNKNGLEIVLAQVQNEKYDVLHFVLGVVNDKDLAEILPLFPKNAKYYFCKPNIPRGLDAVVLQQKAADFSLIGEVFDSVLMAYESAVNTASPADFVYVGGSTFVVAEIL